MAVAIAILYICLYVYFIIVTDITFTSIQYQSLVKIVQYIPPIYGLPVTFVYWYSKNKNKKIYISIHCLYHATLVITECNNPLSPHDTLKHHFTSLKTDSIFLKPMFLERKFPWNWFTNAWQFSLILKPHPIIFIHYKSRIATAIRGL